MQSTLNLHLELAEPQTEKKRLHFGERSEWINEVHSPTPMDLVRTGSLFTVSFSASTTAISIFRVHKSMIWTRNDAEFSYSRGYTVRAELINGNA